jgi:FAD synthetase
MRAKKKILVGGVFDILHYGHIHFLREAKKLGDYLIVALESDQNVKRLKGENRPFHNQNQRREILESLTYVDEVIILKDKMTDWDYLDLVLEVKPNIIAVTAGDPFLKKKKIHAGAVKAQVVEISKIETLSTTKIAKLLSME